MKKTWKADLRVIMSVCEMKVFIIMHGPYIQRQEHYFGISLVLLKF